MTKTTHAKTAVAVRKIIELEENPVRDFLKNNVGIIYSRRRLAKQLGMSKNATQFFLTNSNHVRKCDPHEVGSGRDMLAVYTYCEHK